MNDRTLKSPAPVVVFAYNRVDKLQKCLESLENCSESVDSDLFLMCDGPKECTDEISKNKVKEVQEYASSYVKSSPFRSISVMARDKNRGLANSIITGVTDVINRYGKVIVVEDDLVVYPSFLRFLNDALSHYEDDMRCGSISAFTYPMKCLDSCKRDVFFTQKAECWGWATWANRWDDAGWKDIDIEKYLKKRSLRLKVEGLEAGLDRLMYLQYKGLIDSWAVRWIYHLYLKGMLTVYPTKSRVRNEGFDGSGTHTSQGNSIKLNTHYYEDITEVKWRKCELDLDLAREYAKYPRQGRLFYLPEMILNLLRS